MSDDITETSQTVAAGQLRAFVERIERIEADIKDLNGDKSDVYKELRGFGFDVKAVRQVVAARKLDTAEREERTAMFELYWEALIGGSRVHVHEDRSDGGANINMRHSGIATDLPPHDAETGVIFEDEPETANEKPSGKVSGSDDHSADDVSPTARNLETGGHGANPGGHDVDGSAERAHRAGDQNDALSGQVEPRDKGEIVDGNASLAARAMAESEAA